MVEENVEKDMTPVLLKDLGMRFATEKSKQKSRFGLYQCQYCGKEFKATSGSIKSGNTKSCGCYNLKLIYERNLSHNLSSHPLYDTWRNLKARCYNAKNPRYIDYGGRGIKVCERWLDIRNFIEDMYPTYEEGLSIDRINNDGDYAPDNCRWTTKYIQSQNTRKLMSTNKSGYRGVSVHTSGKWQAEIKHNGKRSYLGLFNSALEAAIAYDTYALQNNTEHTRNFKGPEAQLQSILDERTSII